MRFSVTLDDDLRTLFELRPDDGHAIMVSGVKVPYVIAVRDDYGDPPFIFKPVRQGGGSVLLRLLQPDGGYARDSDNDYVERRAYTSDLRRGVFWHKHTPPEERN
jgi:hypothetical protein